MRIDRGLRGGGLLLVTVALAWLLSCRSAGARPDGGWVLLQREESTGTSRWARRLPIKDNGFPVVLIEEKPVSRRRATIRYLMTVDCNRRLQGIRQFWQSGDLRWHVVDPVEWQAVADARSQSIQSLLCSPATGP